MMKVPFQKSATSIELPSKTDIALIKEENFQTVYLHYDQNALNAVILLLEGYAFSEVP